MADENPFDSPLFDSIEIPTIVDADKQTSPPGSLKPTVMKLRPWRPYRPARISPIPS